MPNFKQKRFGSIVKTFRERCQNYTPRVHKILLKNIVFRIIYQFHPFGLSAVTFWIFGELFLVGLLKMPFMGLEDILEEKNSNENCTTSSCTKGVFWVKLLFGICASHPRIPSDGKCGCSARTFSVGLLKLNLSCPEDTIEKNVYQNIYHILLLFWTVSKTFSDAWAKFFWLKKNSLHYLTLS